MPVYEEEGGLVLPESRVIMEYLEERYPEPALWPADPAERALGRLWLERFDGRLGRRLLPRAARGRGRAGRARRAARRAGRRARGPALPLGREYGLADIGYVPWVLRAQERLEVELDGFPALADWAERLGARPAIAAERELVAAQ